MNKHDKRAMIVTGGYCDKGLVTQLLEQNHVDLIIAVDGGLRIIDELGLKADYIVGDFDTIEPTIIRKYRDLTNEQEINTPVIQEFQPEKDDTDTEIAIQLCIQLSCCNVILVGATGTRLDHTFANIHLLKQLLDAGINASIYDNNNKIYLKNQSFIIHKSETYGTYFSMLPLTECVKNVTLTGFKYGLQNHNVEFGSSLCISNEVVEDTAQVEFSKGILILFETKD